jgi:hypothetical protein
MLCHVIINDFEIGRRMLYVLEDADFENKKTIWQDTDDLLQRVQKNELFHGKLHWCDLDIKHFHVMIVNMLKIMGSMDDMARGDKKNPLVVRLTFLLCGLVCLIQDKTDSMIEMFKINRITSNDVVYDYNATLDVKIMPSTPPTNLKVIVDNE